MQTAPKKVLVVDDSATIREHVSLILEVMGFNVVRGEDGKQGLALLAQNPDVALVVSDVNMPEMDGITMVQKIREQAQFKNIPVIMLTSEATIDIVRKARDQKVSGYLLKPPAQDKVKALIDKIFGAPSQAQMPRTARK